jgi:hypothetical protein
MKVGDGAYDLDFSTAIAAVRSLAGISRTRPDIAEAIQQLARTGALLDCRLELYETGVTGHPVVRYYPTEWFEVLMTAAAENWDEERVKSAICGHLVRS